MMDRYDDEIRALEERLMREREVLMHQAEDLTDRARALAVSPKGLLAAAAVGFLLGELSRPRRRQHQDSMPRKLGFGGVIGGMALALIKAQYGSPLAFAHAAWDYVAARRSARPAPPSAASDYTGSVADPTGFESGMRVYGNVESDRRIAS